MISFPKTPPSRATPPSIPTRPRRTPSSWRVKARKKKPDQKNPAKKRCSRKFQKKESTLIWS
ncbi:hypothetical protein OROHE_022548 [Orobanche hederae]